MDKAFNYLSVLNKNIVLVHKAKNVSITSFDEISKWIKRARNKKFSQRTLAAEVGCSFPTIANIERGSNKVTVDNFLKIVEALGWELKIESV